MEQRKTDKAALRFWMILAFSFIMLSTAAIAQTSSVRLTLANQNNDSITITADDIKAMPHTTLQVKAQDGNTHNYSGVFLYLLLQKAGAALGDSVKKKTVASYVLITAADHYKTVYALAEADTVLSDKKIILADEVDGHPLPQNALPYQVIATNEKMGARMIRQVVSIAVRKAD